MLRDVMKGSAGVRRAGSAALDLAFVAAGRLDGFWEVKLNPWDVSAGALIVEEAGGWVSGLAGGPFDSRTGEVVASNGRIHDQMIEVTRARSSAVSARSAALSQAWSSDSDPAATKTTSPGSGCSLTFAMAAASTPVALALSHPDRVEM